MIAVNSRICPNFKIYLYPNVPRRRRGETTVDNATTTEGMVLQDTTMPPVNDRLGPGVTCAVPDREQLDKVQANILANQPGSEFDGNVTEACESSGRSRRG